MTEAADVQPGEKVWSYYTALADASGIESYIAQDFPPGSAGAPVKAGQLLGYQGRWSGQAQAMMTTWIHLHFAIVRAAEDGSFPGEATPENVLDPSPYLGIALKTGPGYNNLQPLRCIEQSP